MADRTSAARSRRAGSAAESGQTREAARVSTTRQSQVTRPEQVVVAEPPPEPDHPRHRVEPGTALRLADVDPDESEHFGRKEVAPELAHHRDRIADLQARLYAEESAHDFRWRSHQRVPSRGMIGIFNRSHYEDVLVVRVKGLVPEEVWRPRYAVVDQFEQALSLSGVTVVKSYLHIFRDEQRRRLESRLADPDERWKSSADDLRERRHRDEYMAAFEEAIGNTSTDVAPWYVVPANDKWYRNLVIARTIADTLEAMDPRYPAPAEGFDQVRVDD